MSTQLIEVVGIVMSQSQVMLKVPRAFAPKSHTEMDRLVGKHPFATMFSAGPVGELYATPLPLLLQRPQDGMATLTGHLSRANPQVEVLRANRRALVVFMGVNAYISPSWMKDRTQAPTWNYKTAHFLVDVQFEEGELATRHSLEQLVAQLETGRPSPWSIADMGLRYDALAQAVVPFKASVVSSACKFKLGQNERNDVFVDMIDGLRRTGGTAMADAMILERNMTPLV